MIDDDAKQFYKITIRKRVLLGQLKTPSSDCMLHVTPLVSMFSVVGDETLDAESLLKNNKVRNKKNKGGVKQLS